MDVGVSVVWWRKGFSGVSWLAGERERAWAYNVAYKQESLFSLRDLKGRKWTCKCVRKKWYRCFLLYRPGSVCVARVVCSVLSS